MAEKIPKKTYSTLVIDPPYELFQRGKYGAERHYPLMKMEKIKNMPISDLADENAHLWLWAPNGLIPEALELMKAWGFTYRSPFYWIKPRMGLGCDSFAN